MKKSLISIFFVIGLLWYLLSAHNSGAAFGGLGDQTGSPLSVSTCANCHNGGNFSPLVSLVLMDENGQVVNGYKPGASYILEIIVASSSGNPVSYGVQAVALDSLNQNVGSFDSIYTTNTRITHLNNRQYLEQDGFKQDGTFRVRWTAPRYLSFNITFYAVGLVCNGLGNMEGDETSAPVQFTIPPDNGFFYPKMDYCKNEPNPSPVFINVSSGGNFIGPAGIQFADSSGTLDLNNSTSGNYTIFYTVPGTPQTVEANIEILNTDTVDISYSNNPSYILDGIDTVYSLDGGGCNPLVLPQVLSNTNGFFYSNDSNIVFVDSLTGQIEIIQSMFNCGGDCGIFKLFYQSNGYCPGRDSLLVRIFVCESAEQLENEIKNEIYPNPLTGDWFFIKINQLKIPDKIILFNYLGQLIFESNFSDADLLDHIIQFNLPAQLSEGIYFIKIYTGLSVVNYKILKANK